MRIPSAISDAKIVVLTGAGASVPLGCFTTAQFLDDFRQADYRRLSADPAVTGVLDWVLQEAANNQWDIEDLLALLERRRGAVDLLAFDGKFERDVLGADRRVSMLRYGGILGQLIDAIRDKVVDHYSSVETEEAGRLYRPLFREFRLWFRLVPDLGYTLPVFTLNYDIAVELAANQLSGARASSEFPEEALPIRLVDGVVRGRDAAERRWSRRAFEEYAEQSDSLSVVLVKLHGSVRWGRRTIPGRPDEIVELTPGVPRDPGVFETAVLYPTLAPKPTDVEPFRTGYRLLRACLRGTHLLIVIGTTLRDPEVLAELRDAVEENEDLHIVWLGPSVQHETLRDLIGVGAERLAAVRGTFATPLPQSESTLPGGPLPPSWLMGCLRTLALEAYAVEQIAGRPYFGQTLVCDRTNGLGRASARG